MSTILGLGVAFLYVVGLLAAYGAGLRRGRARGWCDHLFAQIARERARRDKLGRFKAQSLSHGGRS
jgi:hypothetical protein